jgi:hypothetical protein
MELALGYSKRKMMAILPVMAGRMSDGETPQFLRFSTFNTQSFPETHSPSSNRSVRHTMDKLFKFNALKLITIMPTDSDVDEIVSVLESIAWADGKDSFNVSPASSISWNFFSISFFLHS